MSDQKEPCAISPQQRQAAAAIDARVLQLTQAGSDDWAIFAALGPTLPRFKWLTDTLPRDGLDTLCKEFPGFYRYAKILEGIAGDIAAGRMHVPGRA